MRSDEMTNEEYDAEIKLLEIKIRASKRCARYRAIKSHINSDDSFKLPPERLKVIAGKAL